MSASKVHVARGRVALKACQRGKWRTLLSSCKAGCVLQSPPGQARSPVLPGTASKGLHTPPAVLTAPPLWAVCLQRVMPHAMTAPKTIITKASSS